MKLRKHIRTQRLEDVRQVGMDRVVDFKFGSGKASNHVILELYASGGSCHVLVFPRTPSRLYLENIYLEVHPCSGLLTTWATLTLLIAGATLAALLFAVSYPTMSHTPRSFSPPDRQLVKTNSRRPHLVNTASASSNQYLPASQISPISSTASVRLSTITIAGNIILTDFKYEILDLLRTHTYEGQAQGDAAGGGGGGSGGDDVRVAVRQIYPMELATTQEGTNTAAVSAGVVAGGPPADLEVDGAVAVDNEDGKGEAAGAFVKGMPLEVGVQRMSEWLQRAAMAATAAETVPPPAPSPLPSSAAIANGEEAGKPGGKGGKKKGGSTKKPKKPTLKQALMQKGSGVSVYGPSVLDHCVLGAGLRPNAKLTIAAAPDSVSDGGNNGADNQGEQHQQGGLEQQRGGLSEDEVCKLVVALGGAEAIVQQLDRPGQQGYIQCKLLPGSAAKKKGSPETRTAAQREGEGEEEVGKEGRKGVNGAGAGASAQAEGGEKEEEVKEDGSGDKNKADEDVVYEEFLPQLLAQHEGAVVHSFPSFDETVDAFFGRIVQQKLKQVCQDQRVIGTFHSDSLFLSVGSLLSFTRFLLA